MSKTERIEELETDVSALEGRIDDLENLEDRIQIIEQQELSNEKLIALLERINKQHREFITGLSTIIIKLLQNPNPTETERNEIIEFITKLCGEAIKERGE